MGQALTDGFDVYRRDELRFLHPFFRESPVELRSLRDFSYGSDDPVPPPPTAPLGAAPDDALRDGVQPRA